MNDYAKSSGYRIPAGTKLIIVDAHDTIFKPDLSRTQADIFKDPMNKERITWMLRYGFLNFIEYFAVQKKIDIVISSDGQKRRLSAIAKQFGIDDKLKAIYGAEHIDKWDYLKRLDKILKDCQTEAEEAVFIGDSQVDKFSAEKYGVPFIQVPNTVSERSFSFNSFLEIDFNRGDYGLELIDLHNIKEVAHNLRTPQLVEEIIKRQEGVLAHLGPVVINREQFQSANEILVYIVKEPSSESEINWNDEILPIEMANYQRLFENVKEFLRDKSVYIQDCYAGSEESSRIPLRIITQSAWRNLFVRHMFRQATDEDMKSFFPEYTLVHLPDYKDLNDEEDLPDELILINLLKKLILVIGAKSSNATRKAVFLTLSILLPKNDMIPVRCSANKADDGSLSLFFGKDHGLKNSLCLNTNHSFFGDDCHGWTQNGFTNIEWGCRTPIDGLDKVQDPEIYAATRKFATLVENAGINEQRRILFERRDPKYHSIASFPISHLNNADRSGVAEFPKQMFMLVKDALGVLPAFAGLSRELATILLLLGYESKWNSSPHDSPGITFLPFYNSDLSIYREVKYAELLYEKLQRSQTQCWLMNVKQLGPDRSTDTLVGLSKLRQFVSVIQGISTQLIRWQVNKHWKIESVVQFAGYDPKELDPEQAWRGEEKRFLVQTRMLKQALSERLYVYKDDLLDELRNAADAFLN